MALTFEKFQASRTDCADIGKAISADMGFGDFPVPGFLYLDSLYIERRHDMWSDAAKERGAYHLLLERDEYISDDLAELERKLFDWAMSMGYDDEEA
jgi:hypothetical protein